MSFEEFVKYFWEFARKQRPAFFAALCLILIPLHISKIRELTAMEAVYQAHSGIINIAFLISAVMVLTSIFNKIGAFFSARLNAKQHQKETAAENERLALEKMEKQKKISELLFSLPSAEADLLASFIDSKTDTLFFSGDDLAARSLTTKGLLTKGERQEAQVLVFEAPQYAFSLNAEHAAFIKSEWRKLHPGGVAKQRKSRAKRR